MLADQIKIDIVYQFEMALQLQAQESLPCAGVNSYEKQCWGIPIQFYSRGTENGSSWILNRFLVCLAILLRNRSFKPWNTFYAPPPILNEYMGCSKQCMICSHNCFWSQVWPLECEGWLAGCISRPELFLAAHVFISYRRRSIERLYDCRFFWLFRRRTFPFHDMWSCIKKY